jgi:hypothetical protein
VEVIPAWFGVLGVNVTMESMGGHYTDSHSELRVHFEDGMLIPSGIESQVANVGRATNGSPVIRGCGIASPDIINLNINKHSVFAKDRAASMRIRIIDFRWT